MLASSIKQSRSYDGSKVFEVRRLLTEQGYGILCAHSNVFRDEDDRTVATFSPYHDISPYVTGEIYLPGYDVEILYLSNFGRIWPKYSNHPVRWRWEWRFLQGRHRLQIGRGSALFASRPQQKNRMVQAPKSWYNRYKSYGAPG